MRFKQTKKEEGYDLPMAPMIDVIFQLIIFFMCSIHFRSLEGKLNSHLPRDTGPQPPITRKLELDEVRIRLVFDATKPPEMTRIIVGQEAIKDWQVLYQKVSAAQQSFTRKNVDIPFKIDADEKIPFQAVVSTLNTCQQAGITNVEFTAKTPVNEPIR